MRAGTKPASAADAKAGATVDLMLEVALCFFRVRALGQRAGLVSDWGGGTFGFLRSLAVLGPLTVPQIAKLRPTSRQRMQRLADDLATAGLVEFTENPKHRRSRLVRITDEGIRRYGEMYGQLHGIAVEVGANLDEAEIQATVRTVKRLSTEVTARIGLLGI